MTKANSRRRRKGRGPDDPHALEPIPKRQPNGQTRRSDNPRATVQAARERHTTKTGADALDPVLGTELGRCIDALSDGDERVALVALWNSIAAAHRNWRQRDIGQTGDPKCATIGAIPDRMETDPSLRVDLRTADERDAAAIRAWREWKAVIDALPVPQLRWALRGALNGFLGDERLWRDRAPTSAGCAAVMALRMINAKPR
jgi:hypothetical protein